ncbi:MAG TPA: DUF2892 domain-containing protein [Algoriphagus sp.]|jgi:hypothetical protein|uniref:YgaP family membrane protein n=1 Tax=Algoriphagus TaxID=246875 RepID=UPI000C5CC108|nr:MULTISPECIES: DUF2892 domain-containing protein [Algoriphagus]MAL13603.1 hypothetical protein [Algoriphagus sp.]MAN86219.1 hypothetical protein [Algoriphagus sp.]QYH38292.1 DUF2892 domain-containing protein [Algoriphagus sp. NBT04N3]HAD49748.1 DUF2892 domain-containing protein [Algoriphagus sp.]HAH38506.1 DUF2892 domain-containing protein [Algoriphagus sp.]|tara:strand:- start:336 stop:548 length:213 start_codon:yes stop_codon:yes gene_type:complete
MKKNMGTTDRAIRLTIAAILVALYFSNFISGIIGIVAIVIAAIFTLTTLVGFCPLYTLVGINTCPRAESK